MREADRQEVIATSGPDVLAGILASMRCTPEPMAMLHRGELAALFGVAPLSLLDGIGSPWVLGTELLDRLPGALTRSARHYLARMLRTYPVLLNHVDARNAASIRWLRRVGFAVHAPVPFGLHGLPFHPFEMRA